MDVNEIISTSEEQTLEVARGLARATRLPAHILLYGDLGAGKTLFTKGLAVGFGVQDVTEVTSPTFTLINQYQGRVPFYHIDLYRLEEPREVATLGLDELFGRDAVVLIEWGERFPQLLPRDRVEIRIRAGEGDERIVEVNE